ncbi:MAG: methylmalonyl Co-A mutase-associated GTPase MeaB [Flavobacteriales bacterium]|nr:methylmalonyl Co-A mutase-associated GTPase MeaB [Flavobacteriales bacterium]
MEGASVLFDQLRQGDRAALGRAITLIESERDADARPARELVERCLPLSGKSLRLGVTGIPGVGKSTLIDALGTWFIAEAHHVAVLAIDPSSARSGGSILGDKTRMDKLAVHDAAFIRPSAAAGNLGGVARRTREAIILCEAAGYDRILVETVGTGQNELEVERMTDLNLLLMIAGAGDELQGIKRGIMESADLIAFTKADGAARERAEAAMRELRNAIGLLPVRPSGRATELMLTSALSGEGIPELGLRIEALHEQDRLTGLLHQHRNEQGLHWMRQAIDMGLRAAFERDEHVARAMRAVQDEVREGKKSPFAAADELLALFRRGAAPLP